MDKASKLLEKWIFEDGQCVTKLRVLRETTLNIRDAEKLMDEFNEKHKEPPLSATFLVLGIKEGNIRRSVICNQETLEATKSDFDRLISVNVYSLQHNSSTSLQTLFNADWSGKCEKSSESGGRKNVCDQSASTSKSTSKSPLKNNTSPHLVPRVEGDKQLTRKGVYYKNDQHTLMDAFKNSNIHQQDKEVDNEMEVDQEESPRKRPQTSKLKEPPTKVQNKKSNNTEPPKKAQNKTKPAPSKKPVTRRSKTGAKNTTGKLKQTKLNFKPI